MSDVCKRSHLKAEGEGTHHRSLEDDTTKVVRRNESTANIEQRLYRPQRIEPRALSSLCPRWSSGHPSVV